VASNGIMLMSDFVKIVQLVEKLKVKHSEACMHTCVHTDTNTHSMVFS